MRASSEKGFTLVEVVMAVAIMGMIAAGTTALISTYVDAHASATGKSQLYREGLMAMEHMTDGVRRCTFLVLPNAHKPTRDILAFSGTINEDDDYYFNDPLFPRIDEDCYNDMNDDGKHGIAGIDDDGDGSIDEFPGFWSGGDDDEDGFFPATVNEDPIDGVDNDGDGNIDEDFLENGVTSGAMGIAGMDDDGDGLVDEYDVGFWGNDDEDGLLDEDSLNETVYTFDSGTNTLLASCPYTGESSVLSTHVTKFEVKYQAPEEIKITLQLTGDDGATVEFVEHVYPRNTFQKTGRRVR
jgi:prepilin-type N-terminal cleavage/methylation domain-containing protein